MTSSPLVAAPQSQRLVSLDVFRGITVAAMLLVNNPGNGNAVYWPLDHADWNGWTPTDLIFPFFLFIVGITTHLSLTGRKARGDSNAELGMQVLRRAAIIFALGLLLNWFPGFSIGHIAGDPDFLARVVRKLLHVRIMGVLQRIALVYAVTGFVALTTSWRTQVVLLAALLLGYWALSVLVPVPDTGATGIAAIADRSHTLAAWIDRGALDWGSWGNHLWSHGKTWDPEGLLSTLPAIGTGIMGLLAGRWIQSAQPLPRRIVFLFAAGLICVAVGLVWGAFFPINKKLWTSSFVVFTGGAAACVLALFMWLIDLRRSGRWTEPFRAFGINPILAFVASNIFALLIYVDIMVMLGGRRVSLEEWFYEMFLAPWLPDKIASLAFALLFVTLWWAILRVLLKRGIAIKI